MNASTGNTSDGNTSSHNANDNNTNQNNNSTHSSTSTEQTSLQSLQDKDKSREVKIAELAFQRPEIALKSIIISSSSVRARSVYNGNVQKREDLDEMVGNEGVEQGDGGRVVKKVRFADEV